MIVCGFAGIGKSTLAKKYKDIVDLESTPFNKNWKIYASVAEHMHDQGYMVLLSCHQGIRRALYDDGYPYKIVMPFCTDDLKEEYIKRYCNRNNSDEFIINMNNHWHDNHAINAWESDNEYGIWYLDKNEYLEDWYKNAHLKPQSVWDLKYKDTCYILLPNGEIKEKHWDDGNGSFIQGELKMARKYNHLFLTKDDAEFFKEHMHNIAIASKYGGSLKWGSDKYMVHKPISGSNKYTCSKSFDIVPGAFYFPSEEKANKFIKDVVKNL